MTYNTPGYPGLVLAVHPTSRGFGWVLFDEMRSPLDWSVASAKPGRMARLTTRFERLLRRYEPSVLVIEEFPQRANGAESARQLHKDIIHLALLNGLDVAELPRHVVSRHFSHVGATTKHEIASYVVSKLDAFSHRLPPKRHAYDGPCHHQPLFDAAALALTYFARREAAS